MAAVAAMNLLSTKDLSKSFGGITAVSNVDFSLKEGEVRGIIGPNGAGKTTLVNLLCGCIQPDSGRIVFRECDITHHPSWRRMRLGIAYAFQLTSIYPGMTVFENVAVGAQMRIRHRSQSHPSSRQQLNIDDIASRCLSLTGLDSSRSQLAAELAYGHQRLLEIAINLALDPVLLILDEPTQGLSESEIKEFADLLMRIHSDRTIVLIEHNMPFVMALADRITVMNQGSILAENAPQAIQKDVRVKAAYLGK